MLRRYIRIIIRSTRPKSYIAAIIDPASIITASIDIYTGRALHVAIAR